MLVKIGIVVVLCLVSIDAVAFWHGGGGVVVNSFLLLDSGSYLLLSDGSKLILN